MYTLFGVALWPPANAGVAAKTARAERTKALFTVGPPREFLQRPVFSIGKADQPRAAHGSMLHKTWKPNLYEAEAGGIYTSCGVVGEEGAVGIPVPNFSMESASV